MIRIIRGNFILCVLIRDFQQMKMNSTKSNKILIVLQRYLSTGLSFSRGLALERRTYGKGRKRRLNMKNASSVVSLVTYTEGIPEFLRFRIHSVYVKEASHSCPHPGSRNLSSHQWSMSQSKLTELQTPPRSDLKYTKCMKRYQKFENKIFRNTIFDENEQCRANVR